MRPPDPVQVEALLEGAAALRVPLQAAAAQRLVWLIEELRHWNRAYNLTSLDDPQDILTHHLLDSLSAHADLAGARIADAGTGGGFPGLPLALVNPARTFTLIDSSAKKLRFVAHAARGLGLDNVTVEHARLEGLRPAVSFDSVVARALAPLPAMLKLLGPLCTPDTRVIAMKGHWPEKGDSEGVPVGWRLLEARRVEVPGLVGERHILRLQRAPAT